LTAAKAVRSGPDLRFLKGGTNMSHRREKRARRTARAANATLMTVVSLEALCFAAPRIVRAQAQPAPSSTTQASASAASQPAPPGDLQEVVVSGFRLSLESALNNKRNSDLAIESLAPEDIGKMPDQNVAEALQRLPGIQIGRAEGFGTQVLIDGLRQNRTTLNGDIFLTGREFYVSGEGSGQGSGGNAQYNSLEGIPSEDIGGIDVYKNPKASMIEGGLGGTIDLKTRDPLAQPMGLTVGGNLRGTTAEGTGGVTPNATLVASYKVNDRLGFTGSFSYDKERTRDNQFQDQNRNQWQITNYGTPPYVGPLTPAGFTHLPQYYIDPQLGYFSNIEDERSLYGANFGATLQVTDAVKTSVSWFHSSEDDTTLTYSNKAWFDGAGGQVSKNTDGSLNIPLIPGIDPSQPYAIDGNGVVTNGVFNANGAETATLFQSNKDIANNYQWVTGYDDGGPLRGTLAAYFSRATSNLQAAQADVEHGLYESSAGVPAQPTAPGCNNGAVTCGPTATPPTLGNHGYEFAYANGGTSGLPSVSYLAPYADLLSNPSYTTFKSNWAWANYTTQENKAFKLDLAWDLSQIKHATLSAGGRFATRDVNEVFGRYLINGTQPDGSIDGGGNGCPCGPWLYYQDPGYGKPGIPYSTATSNHALAQTVNNFAQGAMLVKNPYTGGMTNPSTYLNTVWAGAGVPNNTEQFFEDQLSSFHVHEKTTSGYVMADFGAREDHYHLNAGVRFVSTDLTIDNAQTPANNGAAYYGTASWNGVISNAIPSETKRHYTDVLPSLNLTLNLTDEQLVRLGAARVTAPQDLYQLGLGNFYNFTRVTGSRVNVNTGQTDGFAFSNGNAGNPNLDPYRATQFLLAYENYFARGALASVEGFFKHIDSFVTTANIPTKVGDDFGGTTANVQTPINAGPGKIYGVELSGQYAFGWSLLQGFGVAANYTYSNSTSDQTTSFTQHSAIPGVSKNAFTGTLYYERYGFSGRLAYSWRDKAVNDSLVGPTFTFPDQLGNSKTYQVFQAAYGQLDGQVGYDFNSHLGLVLSAQNLSNESLHTYLQWPNLPFTYDNWGRRYFFGIKFKN
jgi:iron complex outermembrane recepter protein